MYVYLSTSLSFKRFELWIGWEHRSSPSYLPAQLHHLLRFHPPSNNFLRDNIGGRTISFKNAQAAIGRALLGYALRAESSGKVTHQIGVPNHRCSQKWKDTESTGAL